MSLYTCEKENNRIYKVGSNILLSISSQTGVHANDVAADDGDGGGGGGGGDGGGGASAENENEKKFCHPFCHS